MAKRVTEESGEHNAWYAEAKEMTVEKLPAFIEKMREGYAHDYGTICHAIAAAAIAAAWAVERGPQGGITGFQGGAIMWEFIKHWNGVDGPARLLKFDDMLFPQNGERFTQISAETWKHVQEKAREHLAASHEHVSPAVLAHWKSISNGQVPFGLQLAS